MDRRNEEGGHGLKELKASLLLEKIPYRFGSMAIFRGVATLKQVQQALAEQVEDNACGRPHRLIGKILKDKGWITEEQERSILKELFGEMQR